jgi:hypothetical protein
MYLMPTLFSCFNKKNGKLHVSACNHLIMTLHLCFTEFTDAILALLPAILPESNVATISSGKGKGKTKYLRPSSEESMRYFVDVQKVGTV